MKVIEAKIVVLGSQGKFLITSLIVNNNVVITKLIWISHTEVYRLLCRHLTGFFVANYCCNNIVI